MTEDIKVTLWKSAEKLRAQMDAAEYKHIVFGLIFLKYICDSFTAQQDKIRELTQKDLDRLNQYKKALAFLDL